MLGSDSLQFVAAELRLKVAEVHAWTDSLTALYWILGQPHRWKTWVANRVSTIQRTANKLCVEWHHCPGVDNPADLASRGAEIPTLQQSFWQRGPTWLCTRDQWPQLPAPKPSDDSVKEVKLNAVQVVDPSVKPWWERMSSATKVKGVLRWILTWRYRSATRQDLYASVDVVYQRLIQQQCFPQELHALQAGRSVSRESRISKHQPYLDDKGLIRATGRLQMADIDDTAKHPVILADCYLTTLLLRLTHLSRLHQGVEGCLAFLRRRYLILAGRRILRSVKDACVICRRHDGSPATEAVAPLPADRVVKQRPFAVVGVDHAGPLQVKDNDQSAKAWILLFVCATTRAVHLELVMSLSTSDFLHGYRRFVARFGTPQLIRSDNGMAFVSAAQMLAVDWRFNPPASPWHGGFYERLVAAVKAPLRRVLGRALVSRDELVTLLAEVEHIVNERPLTHVATNDEPQPLTPNLLLGRTAGTSGHQETALTEETASRRHRYLAELRKQVASRWTAEYLLTLHGFQQHQSHSLQVGSVVLVVSDQKRQFWKLGLITELYPGRDGKKRVAKVRVGNHEFLRPVQRLVALELVASAVTDELPAPASDVAQATVDPVVEATQLLPDIQSPPKSPPPPQRTRTRTVRPRQRLDL